MKRDSPPRSSPSSEAWARSSTDCPPRRSLPMRMHGQRNRAPKRSWHRQSSAMFNSLFSCWRNLSAAFEKTWYFFHTMNSAASMRG